MFWVLASCEVNLTFKNKTPLLLPLFQDDHYLILVISEPQCFRPNWELSEAIVLSKPKVNNGLRRKILLREWFKQIFSRYELSTQKVIISPMQCRHCALGGLITKNRPETTIFEFDCKMYVSLRPFEFLAASNCIRSTSGISIRWTHLVTSKVESSNPIIFSEITYFTSYVCNMS